MMKPWQLAEAKWNAHASNSAPRKKILKAIGASDYHAARAYAYLPFLIKQRLTLEYARTQFDYTSPAQSRVIPIPTHKMARHLHEQGKVIVFKPHQRANP